jgi:hypothetical protein
MGQPLAYPALSKTLQLGPTRRVVLGITAFPSRTPKFGHLKLLLLFEARAI